MTHCGDINHMSRVVDTVDHSVIANPEPPEIFVPVELDCPRGSCLLGESLNIFNDAMGN
jgi:hypothetical protein